MVIGWALIVAVTGGLTLWMQDSAEPAGPYVWERTNPYEPPDLPPCPTPEGAGAADCAYGTYTKRG
ncbi:hypothetical protein A4E84_26970 [Streptomyces qaidamensis]|uniref:Uncharacterized protein n=1 Tax=Streptomyces qaidamensis TaxID=1783515 RepID=A0A143C5X0_9ACTN|nr:hypothetical protein A4E84_26970 [Streptomyces qaidamensis]